MNFEVREVKLFAADDGKRKFTKLMIANVFLAEIDTYLNGVTLTWSKHAGWFVLAPNGVSRDGKPHVQWKHTGAFQTALCSRLKEMFFALGGKLPEEKPKRIFIPLSELDLGGTEHLPYHERIRLALEDESRCRGVECFTEIWERPDPLDAPERATKDRPDDMPADALEQADKAAAHACRHAVARTATDEDDDVSGLHRTLRVCAVEETMEKAGL